VQATYVVHIAAANLGLIAGFTSLFVSKGASIHRRAGMAFFWFMIVTSLFGAFIAISRGIAVSVNVPAALLSTYMVLTSLLTVRERGPASRTLDIAMMLVAFGVGLTTIGFMLDALLSPDGKSWDGMPAAAYVVFALIGTLAGLLDIRVMRGNPLTGAPRLARHLWRMCFALMLASLSFLVGQSKALPESMRIMPLLAIPLLVAFVAMLYWLWRVRVRRSLRGVVVSVPAPGLP
jgi:hypothetical protein